MVGYSSNFHCLKGSGWVPLFNAIVLSETKNIHLSYDAKHISITWIVKAWLTIMAGRRTDGQTDRLCHNKCRTSLRCTAKNVDCGHVYVLGALCGCYIHGDITVCLCVLACRVVCQLESRYWIKLPPTSLSLASYSLRLWYVIVSHSHSYCHCHFHCLMCCVSVCVLPRNSFHCFRNENFVTQLISLASVESIITRCNVIHQWQWNRHVWLWYNIASLLATVLVTKSSLC